MSRRRNGYRNSQYNKYKLIITAVILLASAVWFVYTEYIAEPAYGDVENAKYSYHFIDVGQGDCTMILSENDCVVIDTGPMDHSMVAVEYIKMYSDNVDCLILTHPHEDHIGGAEDILNHFDVEKVIMPNATADTIVFEKVLDAIEENDVEVEQAEAGMVVTVGDITLELFGPVSESYTNLNNYSIVTRVVTEDISLMVTGDAEFLAEEEMLERFDATEFRSDILKIPHHGSSTSLMDEFLAAVSPEIGVISCGKNNSYGHPNKETIDKLNEFGIEYHRTDEEGSIVFVSDGKNFEKSQ